MEGLKDKERGEGKERLSEHVRGGKRERKRRGRGCAGGWWRGGRERQKDRVTE